MKAAPTMDFPQAKLPADVELEQAVLGLCLLRNDVISSVEAVCAPECFHHAPHQQIAKAVYALARDSKPVTPFSLRAFIGSDWKGDDGGEFAIYGYVADLAAAAPSDNPIILAQMVADLALRRDSIVSLMDAQEALGNQSIPLSIALKPVLEAADKATGHTGKRRALSVADARDQLLQEAEDNARGRKVVAATTGLETLDAVIGGLQAGDFVVEAGRPGMGKSSQLLCNALATARQGRPVLFFSLEMKQKALLRRIGCDIDFDANPDNPLSYSWFRAGDVRPDQVERLATALHSLPPTLEIIENGDLTIHEISSMARAFAARTSGMGLVVIDYIQKIRPSDRYSGSKVQEITEISNECKALALRLDWPVVVGAQLNRAVEGRGEPKPALSDLRESGAIEQDADIVIGLYRPGYYIAKRKPAAKTDPGYAAWEADWEFNKHRLDLLILKNRDGAEESLSVFCDMRASAIRDEKPRGAP